MKLRRVTDGTRPITQIAAPAGWIDVASALAAVSPPVPEADAALWSRDPVALLAAPPDLRARIVEAAAGLPAEPDARRSVLLPFEPRSFRDFMLYEDHAVDAARGFVRTFLPAAWPIARAWEAVLGPPFPLFKPHRLWYRQPIYYMGNHLTFAGDGEAIAMPSYADALDYELELGFVLSRPLFNASPNDAEAAIGGFVVVNDFTVRNVQREEMASGFGPQRSKHFRSGLSAVVVSADAILPHWRDLTGFVKIDGRLVAEPESAGARWSLGEALAHISRSEPLYPGELIATGTLPGGSGIENGRLLNPGDSIEIGIEGVGTLRNTICREG